MYFAVRSDDPLDSSPAGVLPVAFRRHTFAVAFRRHMFVTEPMTAATDRTNETAMSRRNYTVSFIVTRRLL